MFKLLCLMTLISFSACAQSPTKQKKDTLMEKKNPYYNPNRKEAVVVADEVWKTILSPEIYQIARQKGTERPFTSEFEHSKEVGTFHCVKLYRQIPAAIGLMLMLASIQKEHAVFGFEPFRTSHQQYKKNLRFHDHLLLPN